MCKIKSSFHFHFILSFLLFVFVLSQFIFVSVFLSVHLFFALNVYAHAPTDTLYWCHSFFRHSMNAICMQVYFYGEEEKKFMCAHSHAFSHSFTFIAPYGFVNLIVMRFLSCLFWKASDGKNERRKENRLWDWKSFGSSSSSSSDVVQICTVQYCFDWASLMRL